MSQVEKHNFTIQHIVRPKSYLEDAEPFILQKVMDCVALCFFAGFNILELSELFISEA